MFVFGRIRVKNNQTKLVLEQHTKHTKTASDLKYRFIFFDRVELKLSAVLMNGRTVQKLPRKMWALLISMTFILGKKWR